LVIAWFACLLSPLVFVQGGGYQLAEQGLGIGRFFVAQDDGARRRAW
jgi:hypothetical protein